MAEEQYCTIDHLVEHCESQGESKLKVYESIIEGRELIEENYGLMQLYVPSISVQGKQKIKYTVENAVVALLTFLRSQSFVPNAGTPL